jgi:hypothetical protein
MMMMMMMMNQYLTCMLKMVRWPPIQCTTRSTLK